MKNLKVYLSMVATLLTSTVVAADFPSKPIQLIVPYAAGGSTDIAARVISEGMAKRLGTAVFINNKPGASGFLGAGLVARAAPDGYTLLFAGNGIASAPSLKEVTFDLRKDFIPVSKVVSSQFSILVNTSFPAKTLKELIDYGKKNPGKLNVACSGSMTAAHFALEGFRQRAGLDFVTVQFSGNAPAALSVISGQTPVGIDAAFSAKASVQSGRLRALAVTGSKRSPLMPDIPTASEAGVPGYEAGFSLVMLAPAKTPADVIAKIYDAITASLKDPIVLEKLMAQGLEPIGSSPSEYAIELESEIKQNQEIIISLRKSGAIE
ncbi:MAG: tripartite tricarboxylate transporter substrate binding protein [Betaproteobacteria bacterium]